MKIALASMNQKWLDKNSNMLLSEKIINMAVKLKAEVIIFPEMTLTGFYVDNDFISESILDSLTINYFSKISSSNNINIIYGMSIKDSYKITNDLICATPINKDLNRYSKTHLFSYAGESKYFSAGKEIKIFNINGINIGTSICFDLRYAPFFNLMSKKCSGIVCIANWPKSRIFHWHALLKARAIENQLFMFGVNRIGIDGKNNIYEKSSSVISPSGENIKPSYSDEQLDVFDIDFSLVNKVRSNFPFLEDFDFNNYISYHNLIR